MKYLVSPHEQGTDEWKRDRCGRATGSNVAAIFATIKSGEAAARADYRHTLAIERITGTPADDTFVSADMKWGIEHEPEARTDFEAETGLVVMQSGFLYWPDLMVGTSPDGLLTEGDKRGVWECKCPKSKTHLGYLEAGIVPPQYVPQVNHAIWIAEADFADFVSYDPRFPGALRRLIVRVWRDDIAIKAHEKAVRQFLSEVDELEGRLRQRLAA